MDEAAPVRWHVVEQRLAYERVMRHNRMSTAIVPGSPALVGMYVVLFASAFLAPAWLAAGIRTGRLGSWVSPTAAGGTIRYSSTR